MPNFKKKSCCIFMHIQFPDKRYHFLLLQITKIGSFLSVVTGKSVDWASVVTELLLFKLSFFPVFLVINLSCWLTWSPHSMKVTAWSVGSEVYQLSQEYKLSVGIGKDLFFELKKIGRIKTKNSQRLLNWRLSLKLELEKPTISPSSHPFNKFVSYQRMRMKRFLFS